LSFKVINYFVDVFILRIYVLKLDGVGPVDNRPSTDKLHHFVREKTTKKQQQKHVTCDMWHVWGGWTFSQNFSSLVLTVCDLWYYEDLEESDYGLNQWINDEAVYRTAPATPGLLISDIDILFL
jgi:hypothetical protein